MSSLVEFMDGVEEPPTLRCIKCEEFKPITDCYQMKYATGYEGEFKQTCKECMKRDKKVLRRLKKEYASLKPSPHEPCPSCKYSLIYLRRFNQKNYNDWYLHHDHKTEKYLGWVCFKCNTGHGNFYDDPERMRNAANWLEKVKNENI